MLPIHKQIPRNSFEQAVTAHAGLLFDKFPDGWDERNHYKPVDNAKKQFLQKIIDKYRATDLTTNLNTALAKQQELVKNLNGQSIQASTDWRFVSGLGAAHPYETGFIWHRTLSVPYLPGSSVKGMMRAWAAHWGGVAEQTEIARLCGAEDGEANCGALIVFDALPSQPPKLEIDILNPHYSEYYQDSNTPPADYLSPIPVFFLTVAPKQNFEFFLAPRPGASGRPSQDLADGMKLLSDALENLGAGGKTAVGYGFFTESKESQNKREADEIATKQAEDVAAESAALEAEIVAKGLIGLAAQVYRKAQQDNWETCESNPKFYETLLDYIRQIAEEADLKVQHDVVAIVKDIVEKKYPGILQDPERKEGKKKDKPAYKPKPIEIAKALLAIIKP
jgi:CRISPR-associated protein Cmr6